MTCTSKMFRKIPMRTKSASPMSSSGGGRAGATEITTPSAGLTSSPSRTGVTRHGSRKKYAIHRVTTAATHPAGAHSRKSSNVADGRGKDEFEPVRVQRRQNPSQHEQPPSTRPNRFTGLRAATPPTAAGVAEAGGDHREGGDERRVDKGELRPGGLDGYDAERQGGDDRHE